VVISVDVVIVGAGVAGLSAAHALSGLGFGVAVVEREQTFRDRIRGEALHPWGAAEASKLGLTDVLRRADGHELPIWQRYDAGAVASTYDWRDDVPGGHVEWSLSHPALQSELLAAVAAAGTRIIRPGRFAGLRPGAPRAEVDVVAGDKLLTLSARLVIGADGQRSAVRTAMGAGARRDPVHHKLGGLLLDGVRLEPGMTHQAYFFGGMSIAFPRARGRARVYLACSPRQADALQGPSAIEALIATCAAPLPAGAFEAAVPAGPAGFFPAADVVASRLTAPGVVLIGDAAGANDPAQGHGLSLSFRDARELRDLLGDAEDWQAAIVEYERRRQTYFAPLRAHAIWAGILTTETGPESDRIRERVARARELDPTAGGFAGIHAFGPDGLVADDAARRHFFGEDLDD
jgi:2-polyprenyl-6-methoxyphenol hydroxylase-like FAD-dependent oxidoreductase